MIDPIYYNGLRKIHKEKLKQLLLYFTQNEVATVIYLVNPSILSPFSV